MQTAVKQPREDYYTRAANDDCIKGGPGIRTKYTYDAAIRITGISDSGLSSNTWTFGYYPQSTDPSAPYDTVYSATSSALTRGYTYDANGNITSQMGSVAYTALINSSNNQIASTSGGLVRTYSYLAAGEVHGYGSNTYTFNQRDRISSVLTSGGTTNYVYNALGQLIEKSGNGGTTQLMYDEAGHILGEYTSTSTLIEETVWMDDLPVATLQPNGSSISVCYIHSDHLGTPRKITQPSSNTLAWRWDPDTFGSLPPNQNPGGLGTFVYNLRFPGQYYLPETGLYNNYFRDYDPQVGRYVESDPIGLLGVSYSTYAYTGGNPISGKDLFGLFDPSTWVRPAIGTVETATAAAVAAIGAGIVAIVFPTAAGDPNRSDEARPSPTGGGPGCPPGDHCKQMRDAISRLHQVLSDTPLATNTAGVAMPGPGNAKILRLRQDLNDLIDQYNKLCASETGLLGNSLKLPVGPQGPTIPGTPLIHDIYSK